MPGSGEGSGWPLAMASFRLLHDALTLIAFEFARRDLADHLVDVAGRRMGDWGELGWKSRGRDGW